MASQTQYSQRYTIHIHARLTSQSCHPVVKCMAYNYDTVCQLHAHVTLLCSCNPELQQQFPTLRQSRFSPYVPRHMYRPPPASLCIPQRWASSVIGIAKTFTKDIVLVTELDGDIIPRGIRKAVLHDKGRIVNMVDF